MKLNSDIVALELVGPDVNMDELVQRAQRLAGRAQAYAQHAGQFELIDDNPSVGSVVAAEEASGRLRDRLKRQCGDLWAELVALQQQIAEHERRSMPRAASTQRHRITSTLESQLQAELDALSLADPFAESKDETLIQLEVEDQLRQTISELTLTRSMIVMDVEATRTEIERLVSTRTELLAERETLQHRVQSAQFSMIDPAATDVDRDLQTKIRQVSEQNTNLLKQMVIFMDKYFPVCTAPPPATETRSRKRKQKQVTEEADDANGADPIHQTGTETIAATSVTPATALPQTYSLKSLLEDLMNLAVTKPADPYLKLQGRHWGPHVEMLIRAGIAAKHPKDGTRLKLIEFHL